MSASATVLEFVKANWEAGGAVVILAWLRIIVLRLQQRQAIRDICIEIQNLKHLKSVKDVSLKFRRIKNETAEIEKRYFTRSMPFSLLKYFIRCKSTVEEMEVLLKHELQRALDGQPARFDDVWDRCVPEVVEVNSSIGYYFYSL